MDGDFQGWFPSWICKNIKVAVIVLLNAYKIHLLAYIQEYNNSLLLSEARNQSAKTDLKLLSPIMTVMISKIKYSSP